MIVRVLLAIMVFSIVCPSMEANASTTCPRGYIEHREPFTGDAICKCPTRQKMGDTYSKYRQNWGGCYLAPNIYHHFIYNADDLIFENIVPKMWLDASDPHGDGSYPVAWSGIASWKDKSGNGHDANVITSHSGWTHALVDHQWCPDCEGPLTAYRIGLKFDGESLYKIQNGGTLIAPGDQSHTLLMVVQLNHSYPSEFGDTLRDLHTLISVRTTATLESSPNQFIFFINSDAWHDSPGQSAIQNVSNYDVFYRSTFKIGPQHLDYGGYYVIGYRYDNNPTGNAGNPDNCRYTYMTNTLRSPDGCDNVTPPMNFTSLSTDSYLGRYYNEPYYHYRGLMFEVLFYDQALSDLQMEYLSRKLMIKWAIDQWGFDYDD